MRPTPKKPTRSAADTNLDGKRRSRMLSSTATQMGVEAMRIAASALSTRFSASTTKALPKVHRRTPDAARISSSRRVGRTRMPRALPQSKSSGAASRQRMAARANGGKPAPGRTATRMAR
jgi:hypothetical protein